MMTTHDVPTEEALIGCALHDPAVLDVVAVPLSAFTGLRLAAWRAMIELREMQLPIDPLTVADIAAGETAKQELPSYLTDLLCKTLTADNAEYYAKMLSRQELTRGILRASADVQDRAERGIEGRELLSCALELFGGLDEGTEQNANTVGELATVRYHELTQVAEANARGETVIAGYPTGSKALDTVLGGLQQGIVTIIAGRPGMGKSALAMTIADANTADGRGVHVFSLEDTRSAYMERALSRFSNIPAEELRRGHVNREDLAALSNATEALRNRPTWLIDDRSGIDAREVVRSVRRAKREGKTRIVVVDYIQLLGRRRGMNMHEAITESIDTLADAAKQDGMVYVVLSQLNRGLEKRDDKVPRLSDLRESGSIEERAKAVLGIYRPVMYCDREPASLVEVHVLKNSQGQVGYAQCYWDGPTIRIR